MRREKKAQRPMSRAGKRLSSRQNTMPEHRCMDGLRRRATSAERNRPVPSPMEAPNSRRLLQSGHHLEGATDFAGNIVQRRSLKCTKNVPFSGTLEVRMWVHLRMSARQRTCLGFKRLQKVKQHKHFLFRSSVAAITDRPSAAIVNFRGRPPFPKALSENET